MKLNFSKPPQSQSPYSHQPRIRVGIMGARGYSGLELTRLCLKHPGISVQWVSATQNFELSHYLKAPLSSPLPPVLTEPTWDHVDLVFTATPHEASWELVPQLLEKGLKVIDLSGAFRLRDQFFNSTKTTSQQLYSSWYGFSPSDLVSDWTQKAQYGLMPFDLNSQERPLIANPGCYATSVLMALIPLLKENLIDPHHIVIDAKSGTTGAGRKAQETLLFSEVNDECSPYKVGTHQHIPEMEQALFDFTGQQIKLTFNTHLLNVRRGIISSLYLKPSDSISSINPVDHSDPNSDSDNDQAISQMLYNAYETHYGNYPWVQWGSLVDHPHLVRLKNVVGTPYTHISYQVKRGRIYLFSVLDNLLKGAASQAIENFNVIYGLPLSTGLDHLEARV